MSQHSSRGPEWDTLRKQVLDRDNHVCQICKTAQATTVDHIIAKANGGTDELANLIAACRPCNSKKGAKTVQRTNYRSPRWFTPTANR